MQLCPDKKHFMAHSYDFKHTSELKSEEREAGLKRTVEEGSLLTRTQLVIIAGSIVLGFLLYGSWSLDNLFMKELIAVTAVWGFVSLIRLKSQPKK